MNSRNDRELLEAALRRKLTPEEEQRLEAYWAAHPDEQAGWEEEWSLNHLLRQIPDVPLASNFTAQVLRLVERDRSPESRAGVARWQSQWWFSLHWMRAAAVAAAMLVLSMVFYHQYRASIRAEVAQSVMTVFGAMTALSPRAPSAQQVAASASEPAAFPTLEMLEDFEAIKRLNQVPQEVDVELLAALQPSAR